MEEGSWAAGSENTRESCGGTIRKTRYFWEYRSHANLQGIPIVHVISNIWDPRQKCVRMAKGVVAIGPIATGVFSIGYVAFGMITIGSLLAVALLGGIGLVVFGTALAVGQVAVSFGFACGFIAVGTSVVGHITVLWQGIRDGSISH